MKQLDSAEKKSGLVKISREDSEGSEPKISDYSYASDSGLEDVVKHFNTIDDKEKTTSSESDDTELLAAIETDDWREYMTEYAKDLVESEKLAAMDELEKITEQVHDTKSKVRRYSGN